jgi:hypothetical protein
LRTFGWLPSMCMIFISCASTKSNTHHLA